MIGNISGVISINGLFTTSLITSAGVTCVTSCVGSCRNEGVGVHLIGDGPHAEAGIEVV